MKELLEKYPKAADVVINYYTDVFKKSIEDSDVDEEYKQYAKEAVAIDLESVANLINVNPRGTFDVFDVNGVFIEINIVIAEEPRFTYNVNGEINIDPFCTSRKEAEAIAVEKAFEILNEKL